MSKDQITSFDNIGAMKIFEAKIPTKKEDVIDFFKQYVGKKANKLVSQELDVRFVYVANYNNICYTVTGYSGKSTVYSNSTTRMVEYREGTDRDKEWANFASAYQDDIFLKKNSGKPINYYVPNDSRIDVDAFLQNNEIISLTEDEVISISKRIAKEEAKNNYLGEKVSTYTHISEIFVKCAFIPVAIISNNGKDLGVVNMHDKIASVIGKQSNGKKNTKVFIITLAIVSVVVYILIMMLSQGM